MTCYTTAPSFCASAPLSNRHGDGNVLQPLGAPFRGDHDLLELTAGVLGEGALTACCASAVCKASSPAEKKPISQIGRLLRTNSPP